MGLEDGILGIRWDLGLEVGIWPSRLGFGPQDWNLGLKTGIWGGGTVEEEEEEE